MILRQIIRATSSRALAQPTLGATSRMRIRPCLAAVQKHPTASGTSHRFASSSSTPQPPPANDLVEENGASIVPLPILPRALGVPNPPSAAPKTWEEKREELLSKEKHMEKRKFLIKQATSGYYEDLHKTMRGGHGGKMWLAPKVLIREDKALYFPDVSGKSLLGDTAHTTTLCQGKISVVAIMSTQIAEEQVKSYAEHVVKRYQDSDEKDDNFQFIQINLQENYLKSAIVSLSKSSIRAKTPENLRATYLHSSQNMEMLRQPMGFENKHLGFVYLVDENVKIRWAGCGFGIDEERTALMTCTRLLLTRLKEVKEAEAAANVAPKGKKTKKSPNAPSPDSTAGSAV